MATAGTGSSWGEAIAILGSMASDAASIYGLAEQPIPATLVTAETLGSVVSNAMLWEELLKTRNSFWQIEKMKFLGQFAVLEDRYVILLGSWIRFDCFFFFWGF